ncbi:MAG TPA: hypothetical protein DD490_24615 [Acidobacteria bacterium]|nr:hypothetical protein [Acidobacteriota bacterium]
MWTQEVKQVARSLVKSPGFALAVLLTLAVGIGATAAIFSIVEGLIIRKIPYKDLDRLVMVYNTIPQDNLDRTSSSYLDLMDWRKQNTTFTDLCAQSIGYRLTLVDEKGTDSILMGFVSSAYFEVLGYAPMLGRTFTAEEEKVPMGSRVVVLSNGLWRNRFSASREIVGQSVRLNGELYTVVGVMPPDFRDLGEDDTEMWAPIMMLGTVSPGVIEDRNGRNMEVLGRLKPGVTIPQAQAEMGTIIANLEAQYPESNKGYGINIVSLEAAVFRTVFHLPNVGRSVMTLFLGSIFVLLIACVNVASLFLVRATVRRREMGIRIAVGAGRRQIIRRLVIEGVMLSLMGGVFGVMVAAWAVKALLATGLLNLPPYVQIGLSPKVVALSLVLSLATGVIFGLVPAAQTLRRDLLAALQEGSRGQSSRQGGRWRSALVVAEVALAVILLVGAGLMMRSFRQLHGTSLGFRTDNLLTVRIDATTTAYREQRPLRINLARSLEEGARAIPGVRKAGVWGPGIPGEARWYVEVTTEDKPDVAPEEAKRVYRHHISPDALSTLGIPILKGRDLSAQDTVDTPLVAVVSQSMAEALWPGEDPIGKKFLGAPSTPLVEHTVVGVAQDVRHRGRLTEEGQVTRDYYCSYYQYPVTFLVVYLIGESDPAALFGPLRKLLRSIDPDLAIYEFEAAANRVSNEEAEIRLTALLMTTYAVMALTLAALGIYGVLAYAVSRRTGEIGVRMALGADRSSIYREVVGQAMIHVLIGLALGLAGAIALTRVLTRLLFQVTATDPATFVLMTLVFLAVALLASSLPARRAMAVDPVKALRSE